jgi:hypothetical protein
MLLLKNKSKKQIQLHKDFGYSEEVDSLIKYMESRYKEMLNNRERGEIEFFEGLNMISENVSNFDPIVVELAELRLEYRFKDNLLFKFIFGAISAFCFQFLCDTTVKYTRFSHQDISQFDFLEKFHIPSIETLITFWEKLHIHYAGALITLIITFYFFGRTNDQINQLQRIVKYALVLQHHPDKIKYLKTK